MAVRIVDIDVSEVNRSVDAETLQQIAAIGDHYGHAGPLFVQLLIEHGLHRQAIALRERVASAGRHIAGDADGAMVRAAIPFALLLIAGELAKSFDLIPASTAVEDGIISAWRRFRSSSDSLALDPEAHAIANMRAWIAERREVTIKPTEGFGGATSREAQHGWYDDHAVYIPKARIREAAGDALKASHIGKLLHERGLLAQRPERDRYTAGWVPNVGRVECYALRRSEFGRSEHAVDPDSYVVHHGAKHA